MTPAEPRLRIVPDPNILVSAFISPLGIPAVIVLAWRRGAFELVVSQRLIDELREVLRRPKFNRPGVEARIDAFLQRLLAATVASDPPVRRIVPDDEKDDYIMVLAQATGADYVVSGDPHLTRMRDPEPPVLTPRAFHELLLERGLVSPRP